MPLPESSTLCRFCQEFADREFYHFTASPDQVTHGAEPRGLHWGRRSSRTYKTIRESYTTCDLCHLVYHALALDTRSVHPGDTDEIYYYCMLYGDYGENKNGECSEAKVPPATPNKPVKDRHYISRLHVSSNQAVLDKVGVEHARLGESLDQEWRSPMPDEIADGDILLLGDREDTELSDYQKWLFHGRRICTPVDAGLLCRWVKTCRKEHSGSCTPMLAPSGHPKRLIDIKAKMVIDPSPRTDGYSTLTYVWGGSRQLELTRSTYSQLTTPDSLLRQWEDIALTIRDAINICERMGIPYLWVDSLCILQDDPEDKKVQLPAMSAIYGGAELSIVAADGENSWAGIPGVREGSRTEQITKCVNNLPLAIARPIFSASMRDTLWKSRGWTFQEGHLSKRLLIFTKFQVFFQCCNALWSEDTYSYVPKSLSQIRDASMPNFDQPFWKNAIPSSPSFEMYDALVQDYTVRQLTHDSDALAAFEGIVDVLSKQWGCAFYHGLPARYFDAALCFEVPSIANAPRRSMFPSWSWAHWEHGGTYREGCTYDLEDGLYPCFSLNVFYGVCDDPSGRPRLKKIDTEFPSLLAARLPSLQLPLAILYNGPPIKNLLVFKARSCFLVVDYERAGSSEESLPNYSIRPRPIAEPAIPDIIVGSNRISSIHLPVGWRCSRPASVFEFITVALFGRVMKLHLIETDPRHISRRVNVCSMKLDDWVKLRPEMRTVYLA